MMYRGDYDRQTSKFTSDNLVIFCKLFLDHFKTLNWNFFYAKNNKINKSIILNIDKYNKTKNKNKKTHNKNFTAIIF